MRFNLRLHEDNTLDPFARKLMRINITSSVNAKLLIKLVQNDSSRHTTS